MTTHEFLQKRVQEDLWNVTVFVASMTAANMGSDNNTPNILSTLAKLRDQVAELKVIA